MLNNSQEALHFEQEPTPDQTHLGWRTLPADAGNGQDRLLLGDPSKPVSEPLVQFLDPNASERAEKPSLKIETCEVHDSALEAPPFLWGGNDQSETTASNQQPLDEPYQPLVVFADTATDEVADATVFS